MQHEFISLCACLLYLFTYLLISTKAFNSETPKTWKKKKRIITILQKLGWSSPKMHLYY